MEREKIERKYNKYVYVFKKKKSKKEKSIINIPL